MRPGRRRARRRRSRALRARRRLARRTGSFGSRRPALRRLALALALLVVVLIPLPGLAADTPPKPPACAGSACHARPVAAQRWSVQLPGSWAAGKGAGATGDGGTVPAGGQAAYVAVGGGVAAVGTGLNLAGYQLATGRELWPAVTLDAPAGTAIVSVRAWPGVITVGLLAPGGHARTEVVIDAATGAVVRKYPAAVFGGAVSASAATAVVISRSAVTSYDNATGRVRWQRGLSGAQSWQADGGTLYLAEARGGYLSSSPVTALKVVNLATGTERTLNSPLGQPFSGTLAMAADGTVLFASSTGVTAYSGSTGGALWTMSGAVPEGNDPVTRQIDLMCLQACSVSSLASEPGPAAGQASRMATAGTLAGVDPLTGNVRAALPGGTVTGSAAVYVVRGGVALGLNSGMNGTAWGYDLAKGSVEWTSPPLPWPHFFSDLSGLGGSAAASGDLVVVTACQHLAASPGLCADPRLVAFAV